MAAGNNVYTPEGPLVNLQRSSTSIHMTLISIIQGAVLSYLAVVVADNFRDFDLARWLMAVLTFLTIVGAWQETIMATQTRAAIFRFRDSFIFFTIGAAEFMLIRAIVPDVAISYFFFFGALFLLISLVYLINQYRIIQTKGAHQEVLDLIKVQMRLKAKFLFVPMLVAAFTGVLLLFIYDLRLFVALLAVNLLMNILSMRQQAGTWNRIFRYTNKVEADNLPKTENSSR
jgi:hypothetical protein